MLYYKLSIDAWLAEL